MKCYSTIFSTIQFWVFSLLRAPSERVICLQLENSSMHQPFGSQKKLFDPTSDFYIVGPDLVEHACFRLEDDQHVSYQFPLVEGLWRKVRCNDVDFDIFAAAMSEFTTLRAIPGQYTRNKMAR